jgi:uncharacterized membrane protein HdeD (DUF308 family)
MPPPSASSDGWTMPIQRPEQDLSEPEDLMKQSSWWMFGIFGLVAIAGGGIVVTQVPVSGVAGMGASIITLGILGLLAAVHYRREPATTC